MARVVVVDDDEQTRTLVEKLLVSGGHQVTAVGDPTEAVATVRKAAPDIVLCDITMPVMDGYAVLRALQADPETAVTPVVFITGHREFTERVKAFKFGVVDYVTKPFSREMLLRRMDRLMATLRERSGAATAEGAEAETLVEEVRRDGRSGMLTVETSTGQTQAMVRAGQVLGPVPRGALVGASFEELETPREDIVAHDPKALPSTPAPLPRLDSLPAAMRTALVADDNDDLRRFLRVVLTTQNFTVHEARDGEEGLRLALEHRPWLILADVRMPKVSGFEFCRRVRSHAVIRKTPFLFLSGWDDYKVREEALGLGADDFISKDTSVRELLIRIHLLLKRYADIDRSGATFAGRVEAFGAPGILQVCHLNRMTGILSADDGPARVAFRFRNGEVVDAEVSAGRAALFGFLAWERGRFEFEAKDPGDGEALDTSFTQLLLEGCRLLDESRRSVEAG